MTLPSRQRRLQRPSGSAFRFAGLALLGWLSLASATDADIIYNNLVAGGGAESSDKTFANIGRWAQQFTASSGGPVTNVKLNMYRRNTQSGTFDVQLWSGTGTTPAAPLVTLKTLNWADVPLNNTTTNTSTFIEITSFANNATLVAAETYWLVIGQAAEGPQAKRWSVAGSGGQTATFSYVNGLWTNQGTAVNLGAQIAVPEPATLGMAPGGALCAGGRWIRTRRRQARRRSYRTHDPESPESAALGAT